MTELSKTERVLIYMLKENTGLHFLDSSSYYGSNFQRNQKRSIIDEPELVYKASVHNKIMIEVTRNVFHFLNNRLEYDGKLTKEFVKFCRDKDCGYPELMENFIENRIHGGFREVYNSYNWVNNLSQVIQFAYFEIDSDPHVILQIHNGCDVRGGYTDPKIFRLCDDENLFPEYKCSLWCMDCRSGWDTYDDGSSFRPVATEDNKIELSLSEYVVEEIEPGIAVLGKAPNGLLVQNHKILCPICGIPMEVCE